jgi:methylenetetrahydrofolate reductase (NADPH)
MVNEESQSADKGRAARLERAARMVAILKGLGYAGAYLGGTQNADDVRWIIERGKSLTPRWEELAEELNFAPKRAFYLNTPDTSSSSDRTSGRAVVARVLDTMVKLFPVNKNNALRRLLSKIFGWVDRKPSLAHKLERMEAAIKVPLFGCVSCGNCVLGSMEYICPQTCPKQMRNGPCGGTNNLGTCEVVEKPCIWGAVYANAKAANSVDRLGDYIPAPDRALQGTSSWINYFLNRDVRPGTGKSFTQLSGSKFATLVQIEQPTETVPAEQSDLVPTNTEATNPHGR